MTRILIIAMLPLVLAGPTHADQAAAAFRDGARIRQCVEHPDTNGCHPPPLRFCVDPTTGTADRC